MGKGIEIITAKRAGFCFGVKRAVDMAFQAAVDRNRAFTLGPIIHNPQVIEQLTRRGVVPTDNIDDPQIETLIIRTHGVPKAVSDRLSEKGYGVVDATCPFVKKAQHYARLLSEDGYQVVIIGDRLHPEVESLVSYAGEDVVVVNRDEPMPVLKSRVGVVVQTTQPVQVLKGFVADAIGQVKEIKVFNTICNSTALRLKETRELAERVDLMMVVGGKNSANTTQLAQLCSSLGVPVYHVETAGELMEEWFNGVARVGLTAGASTPDWIIEEVQERITDIGGKGQHV